jgi:hypothetical protein
MKTKTNLSQIVKQTDAYQDAIELIFKRFSQGFTKNQIIQEIIQTTDIGPSKTTELVETAKVALVTMSPEFAMEVVSQVRLGLANTMKTIEDLYEAAETKREQQEALSLKLKALSQLRDLAPRQVQMDHFVQTEDETRRILFEVHGIDPNTVIDGDE